MQSLKRQFAVVVVQLCIVATFCGLIVHAQNNGIGFNNGGGGGAVTLSTPTDILTTTGSPGSTLSITKASQTANKVWASPDNASGVPTFRALVNRDLPLLAIATGGTGAATQQGAVNGILGFPSVAKGDLAVYDGTNWVRFGVGSNGNVITADSAQTAGIKWAAPGTGTVTSVDQSLTGLPFITVAGNPVTSSGTLALTASCATGDLIYGSASNVFSKLTANAAGTRKFLRDVSSAIPAWDTLVAGDIPTIDISTGTTSTLPLNRGGTGQTTQQAALNAVCPSGTTGDILYYNGTNWINLPRGSNTQVLTATSTTINWAAAAGFANPMTTSGDIMYEDVTPTPTRLAKGKFGQRLITGTPPSWGDQAMEPTPLAQHRKVYGFNWNLDNGSGTPTSVWSIFGQSTAGGLTNVWNYDAISGSSGSHATSGDANGLFEQYTTGTASGNHYGVTTVQASETQYQYSPKMWGYGEIGSTITSYRLYTGLGSGLTDIINNNGTTSGKGAFLRYDSALDGTTYHLVTFDNSGTSTSVDTGVTVVAGGAFYFELDETNPSSITLSVNGSAPVSSSTHLPAATQNVGPYFLVETLTTAARTAKLSSILISQN